MQQKRGFENLLSSQNVVEVPLMVVVGLSLRCFQGRTQGQSYFHNNIKMLFAFCTYSLTSVQLSSIKRDMKEIWKNVKQNHFSIFS